MTTDQVNYQKIVEDRRHNLASEQETYRSNVARESETYRSNRAKEDETIRSNKAREYETNRHNVASENLGYGQLSEQIRSNQLNEQIAQSNLLEQQRHNQKTEEQQKYHDETVRAAQWQRHEESMLKATQANALKERELIMNMAFKQDQMNLERLQAGIDMYNTTFRTMTGIVAPAAKAIGGK